MDGGDGDAPRAFSIVPFASLHGDYIGEYGHSSKDLLPLKLLSISKPKLNI